MDYRKLVFSAMLLTTAIVFSAGAADVKINTVGMNMVRIKGGTFSMGSNQGRDFWDEAPVRRVTISKPFYISETEVTIEQFRQFRPGYVATSGFEPYAAGVSYNDAVAYCEWLSKKEGIAYRLATEAEWEYACRAGTTSLYWSGDKAPDAGSANPWGLKNMHTGVREWCYDWYGEYPNRPHVDPVGPESGMTRVVRGGSLDDGSRDSKRKIFNASTSRASIAPAFGPYPARSENSEQDPRPGQGNIGLRVVQAPMPGTRPWIAKPCFASQAVKANKGLAKKGPDMSKTYFRKRYLLPTPLENRPNEEIDALGMHPSFRRHCHSPGLEVCPNGDVLMVIYTSYREYEPGVSLIASRLRFGTEEWDMPEKLFDFVAVNDHCPLLWTEGEKMYFFWGNPKLVGGFPFQWITSDDSGATWSEVQFPNFVGKIGAHSRQPINTIVRDKNGKIYVSSDGAGGRSVLWASEDREKIWYDTGGRSGGRHTTFALLGDGTTILGMGGKSTDIDGFMPKSITTDGGKSYEVTKTPFPAQGGNQRPSLIRLQSGNLFFAGDWQHISGRQPDGIRYGGSYVALSKDDGKNWKIKPLPGTQQHENPRNHNGNTTIGYSCARQAPNGMIHLITTMNRPCLHFELNEAWILNKTGEHNESDQHKMSSKAKKIPQVDKYKEQYASGKTMVDFGGGVADDGRFLLDGAETSYYENGHKMHEVTYKMGHKVGTETYWSIDGKMQWKWQYFEDGVSIWTQYWPNGKKRAQSNWRNFMCEGIAALWDIDGNIVSTRRFTRGEMVE